MNCDWYHYNNIINKIFVLFYDFMSNNILIFKFYIIKFVEFTQTIKSEASWVYYKFYDIDFTN